MLYFTILLSHTALAVAVVPLVTLTLLRAVRRQYSKHASLAQVTFPIWLYVAITGVVIYFMLYHFPSHNQAYRRVSSKKHVGLTLHRYE